MKMIFTLFLSLAISDTFSQSIFNERKVAEIRWETDYQVFLKMLNDSNYTYDIRNLFHIPKSELCIDNDYIYYPVNLGSDFLNGIKTNNDSTPVNNKTLFGALHNSLGGGWVHFINCLLYSMEKGQLSLTAPLMQRPVSNWKPDPVTESYKRTKKWKYYVPVNQKNALKEYKFRIEHDDTAALNGIPADFISLFLKTSDKEYKKMRKEGNLKNTARIDLVRLMLGSNYLGPAQITYIKSMVLTAVKNYSVSMLPTVLIFDEFDAAAVTSLDLKGYSLEAIVFRKASEMTEEEIELKKEQIFSIIENINKCNSNTFIKNLGNYYKN